MNPRLLRSLDEEIERLRVQHQRALPMLGVLLLPAAAIQVALDPFRGAVYVGFALFGVVLPMLLDDRRAPHANLVLVALVPVLASGIVQLTRGPFVAGTSYLVPILFCTCVGISAFQFRPLYVMVLGGLAVAFYVLDYALLLRPALSPEILAETPFDWTSQLTRIAFMLAFTGAAARAVAVAKTMFFRAAAAARASELFAKYRLERLLGKGGMGEVWAATYCPEGGFVRPVAVKMIQGKLANDNAFVDAFRREAELSARLQHKNIVQVLDFGREDDRWFLTMEYVDGLTLSGLIRKLRQRGRRLPPALALYIAREIVEAVAYAHRDATGLKGEPLRVIHRDLAPANVLISRTGQVKVTDFGVAWVRSASKGRCGFSGLVGHFGYLSPEQARGAAPDERTDLYAVGVVLWEMLTGRRLFAGRTLESLLTDVENLDVMAPSKAGRGVAEGPWDAIVARAMAPSPRDRFPSARAFADSLGRALDAVGWPRDHALASLVEEMLAPVPEPASISLIDAREDTVQDDAEGSSGEEPIEELSTELRVDTVTTPGWHTRAAS